MSKRKRTMDDLPTMNIKPGQEVTSEPGEALTGFVTSIEPVEVVETSTPAVSTISVSTPFISWDVGYTRRSLDVKLTGAQAATLKGIWHGLERQEAQLASGKYVANPVDAIRWLLENVK